MRAKGLSHPNEQKSLAGDPGRDRGTEGLGKGKRDRLVLISVVLLAGSAVCFAASDGGWLKKVPQADRERRNPYAGQSDATAAGHNLYADNCAKCHGAHGEGHGSRPALVSARVGSATDGEIAWILRNGSVFHGMPSWGSLPEQERWQIVSYLRSLNTSATEHTPSEKK